MDGKIMAARVAGRYVWSKLTGQALYGAGGSLQGRMLQIALKLQCELWTEAGLVELDLRNGRVEGVHANRAGRPITIRAMRGVLIAAGGFARNSAMRQKYQRHPISDEWTWANPGDTGEAIEVMQRAGAAIALMDEAWWNTTWFPPGGQARVIIPEMAKPHGILVDHAGKRFVNEANSYMEVGSAMYTRHATTPAIPAWFVVDMRARKRYFFGFQPPGRIPRQWIERGWVQVDHSMTGLAQKCRIDPAGLEATVARYNTMCETGVDADYGRGNNAYNRYYADPTYQPNPCMGPISEPPFWAAPIYPGDVGTCGGAITNERAEVVRADGNVIEGLYAAGNCTASLCGPYYVGAGQSIGASSIFGYIAAKQAAR
jgi:3-oxosteroid 1-dehydrogenase